MVYELDYFLAGHEVDSHSRPPPKPQNLVFTLWFFLSLSKNDTLKT